MKYAIVKSSKVRNNAIDAIINNNLVAEVFSIRRGKYLKFSNLTDDLISDYWFHSKNTQEVNFKDYIQNNYKFIKDCKVKAEELFNSKKIDKVLSIDKNYVNLGQIKEGKFIVHSSNIGRICCSFTKTTSDLEILIPKRFLTLFGHNKTTLIKWLEFLKNADIGFEYMISERVSNINCNHYYKYKNYNIKYDVSMDQIKMDLIKSTPCFVVTLVGDKEYHDLTYLRFLLLRYIYNSNYYDIPTTAMALKCSLKDKITNLQAIILAMYKRDYNGYYALYHSNNIIADYQVSTQEYIEAVKAYSSINSCVDTIIIDDDQKKVIRDLLVNKKYTKFLEIVEKLWKK